MPTATAAAIHDSGKAVLQELIVNATNLILASRFTDNDTQAEQPITMELMDRHCPRCPVPVIAGHGVPSSFPWACW